MEPSRSTLGQVAVALLGIVAVGGVAFGVVLLIAAPGAGNNVEDSLRTTAVMITAAAGVMGIAFGILAAFGARLLWVGHPSGTLIGYGVAIVIIIGPVVAGMSGGWQPAL